MQHNRPNIKICGIRDAHIVESIVDAGVNMLGLIFDPISIRYVDQATAKPIVDACNYHGATPVAVFVNQSTFEMQAICATLGIKHVQLHGETARLSHLTLSSALSRIYVVPVCDERVHITDNDLFAMGLIPERDSVLLDNAMPGRGMPFDRTKVCYEANFKLGVAGGIHINNVQAICQHYTPTFIDVSSSVEISPGVKDVHLIKKFVQQVEGFYA